MSDSKIKETIMVGGSFYLKAQFNNGWPADEIEHAMDCMISLPANKMPAFVGGNETAQPRLMYPK